MTSELVRVENVSLEPRSQAEAWELSQRAVASRLFGAVTPEQALVIIHTGRDLGLSAMQSLRGIYVVSGRPVLSADLMVAVVRASPACLAWRTLESTAERCTITTTRRGDDAPTVKTWTLADAQRADLPGKGTWRQYPAQMLRHRCAADLAREVYSDLLLGLYDPDEMPEDRRPAVALAQAPAARRRGDPPDPEPVEGDDDPEPPVVEDPLVVTWPVVVAGVTDAPGAVAAWVARQAVWREAGPGVVKAAWDILVERVRTRFDPPPSKTATDKRLKALVALALAPPPDDGGAPLPPATPAEDAAEAAHDAAERVAIQTEGAALALAPLGVEAAAEHRLATNPAAWAAYLAALSPRGADGGAGHVAGAYWKRRQGFLDAGTHATAVAATVDELTARGVAEAGAWLQGIGEKNGYLPRAEAA